MAQEHDTNGHIDSRTWELLKDRFDKVDRAVEKVQVTLEKQNGRVGRLENWKWYVIGIGAGISIAVSKLLS